MRIARRIWIRRDVNSSAKCSVGMMCMRMTFIAPLLAANVCWNIQGLQSYEILN